MRLTTKQLFNLLLVLSDIDHKELAKRLDMKNRALKAKIYRKPSFQFIKLVFEACDVPFIVEYEGDRIRNFCLDDLCDSVPLLAMQTKQNLYSLKRWIEKENIKLETLQQIFKSKGSELNFIINGAKFKLK